jgi:hypothetical protein
MIVLRLEVSVYNVYITNQFQTTFAQGEGGGGVIAVYAPMIYTVPCIMF